MKLTLVYLSHMLEISVYTDDFIIKEGNYSVYCYLLGDNGSHCLEPLRWPTVAILAQRHHHFSS